MEMAKKIYEAIEKELPVIIEAGTGTGKTFGYLVPIILSGKKTVISTGTKNLQEQIFFKDLPMLQEVSGLKTNAVIMKGRKNYLCLYRYSQFFSQPSLFPHGFKSEKKKLDAWLEKTAFGDRAELDWLADDDPLWDSLSSTSDQCLGVQCVFFEDCFLSRLRSTATRAGLIIVNHHLFFADLKVKKAGFSEIIPRFQVVLFDEAHSLEEIGTTYFGESVSTHQIMELAGDMEKLFTAAGGAADIKLKTTLARLKTGTDHLLSLFEDKESKGRLDKEILAVMSNGPARDIHFALREIVDGKAGLDQIEAVSEEENTQGRVSVNALRARAEELNHLLDLILHKEDLNWLNWYERRKRTLILYASPLDIAERMDELLYRKVPTTAFTSATLATDGNFDYIRSRLNIPERAVTGIYPSHFDFKTQTLMYIPKDLPNPGDPLFSQEVAQRIATMVEHTQGRSLVLFTSYHNLDVAWHFLKGRVPYTVLRQGDAPRSMLLDRFREDVHSILLGTSSFWQGVDVPGESLSCLIVDKLPFESPADPLVAARIDAIRERGGNPFMEYQLPSAIIVLKQGLGRLIRKGTDKGILSILDKRIISSRYGKTFLASLPTIPITHEIEDIGMFLNRRE